MFIHSIYVTITVEPNSDVFVERIFQSIIFKSI